MKSRQLFPFMLLAMMGIVSVMPEKTQAEPLNNSAELNNVERGLKKKRKGKLRPVVPIVKPKEERAVLPKLNQSEFKGQHIQTALARVPFRTLQLQDSTVISSELVGKKTHAYITSNTVSMLQLQNLRHDLSQYYLQQGYINSGVIIPDQDISDGKIRLQAIEGKLDNIEVQGLEALQPDYVRIRLRQYITEPLNINNLKYALLQLKDDAQISQLNAQLVPGETLGASLLKLRVRESKRYFLKMTAGNYRSPSIGEKHLGLSAGNNNLLGRGDALSGEYTQTEGARDYQLNYVFPLLKTDTLLGLSYQNANSIIVEEPFDQIDINSTYEKRQVFVEQMLIRNSQENLSIQLGTDLKYSKSEVDGVNTSLSTGAVNGVSRITAVAVNGQWLKRKADQVVAGRLALRKGIDLLDATINQSGPDSEFFSVQAQLQYLQKLKFWRSQFSLNTAAQYSPDALMPMEKFSIGGSRSVRGYRENQYLRDNGFSASMALKKPIVMQKTFLAKSNLFVQGFVDSAYAWDSSQSNLESAEFISSIGAGIEWLPIRNAKVNADYAVPLNTVPDPGEKQWQDLGFHILMSYLIRF